MTRFFFAIYILLCFSPLFLYSQKSIGGIPPGFDYASTLRSVSETEVYHVVPDLDVERLRWEDEVAESNKNSVRVAVVVPVDIDMSTTGRWTILPDSTRIWQQTVWIEGANGLTISYSDFYIPEGGELFIYNRDKTHILGAYTHDTYPKGGRFATEAITGDYFTLEYVASQKSAEEPRIVIESVGYMYRNLTRSSYDGYLPLINSSAGCIRDHNVNCKQGDDWKNQKRGVVLYFVKVLNTNTTKWEWRACSGSLINNTKEDAIPYVLTAYHCFFTSPIYDEAIVYFNHEFTGCNNETVMPNYKTLVGITACANIPLDGGSDSFLFKLKDNVPKEWKPYYNGWDRRNNAAKSGAVIHHPYYDVKKIAIFNKAVTAGTYIDGGGLMQGANNAHWKVVYSNSMTEAGSSGSPLFNENGLIVGTLSGGAGTCSNITPPDYYGKLWYGWDRYPDNTSGARKLVSFLDPLSKGVEYLAGYDPNGGSSGIEDEIDGRKELILFPVPADNELNINTRSIIKSIKVYNILGQQVFSRSGYSGSTATIDIGTWTKGTYTINIQTESKILTDKFIKK